MDSTQLLITTYGSAGVTVSILVWLVKYLLGVVRTKDETILQMLPELTASRQSMERMTTVAGDLVQTLADQRARG